MRALPFHDRVDAGCRLAEHLLEYSGRSDVLVLALPRGGVAVGAEVGRRLGAPLDIILVRKLGVPWHEEFAMGAIASGGVRVLSSEVVSALGVSDQEVAQVAAAEEEELVRQERLYRGSRPIPVVEGRTVILVDDGLATGATMRAAVTTVRARSPARLVVAVPVAPTETCAALRPEVDELVCLFTPEPFHSVGSWYEDFRQITDEEVQHMLIPEPSRPRA